MAVRLEKKPAPLTALANTLGALVLCHIVLSLAFGYAARRCEGTEWLSFLLEKLGVALPPLACVGLGRFLLGRAPAAEPLFGGSRWRLFVTLLCTLGLVNAFGELAGSGLSLLLPNDAAGAVRQPATGAGLAIVLVFDCLFVPICEESFYRGVLQGALRPYGQRFAVLVTSLLFALAHYSLAQLLPMFCISVFLGYAAMQLGSSKPCVPLRMAYNAVVCLLTYGVGGKDGLAALGITLVVLASCLLFGVYGAVDLRRQYPPRLERRTDPRNRQSRAELLAVAPLFSAAMITLLAQTLLQSLT